MMHIRNRTLIGSLAHGILAITVLMLPVRPASADPLGLPDCSNFATWAAWNAQRVRELGGCGFNLSDEALSTNPSTHMRWCISVDADTAFARRWELEAKTRDCVYCSDYALKMAKYNEDFRKWQCEIEYPDYKNDLKWVNDYEFHYKGCMVTVDRHTDAGYGPLYDRRAALSAILGNARLEIAVCKSENHPRPGLCKTCHEASRTPAALLPAALRSPPKRGTNSGNFSVIRQTPSFKPEGTSSGGSDEAKPSGERRRTPGSNRGTSSGGSDQAARGAPSPCGSEFRPCKPQRVLGPGLLDGGGALGTQGPAATGSPMQTAPPQFQRGSGGGGSGLR